MYTIPMNCAGICSWNPAQGRRAFERAAAAGGDARGPQREVERRMFEAARTYMPLPATHRIL